MVGIGAAKLDRILRKLGAPAPYPSEMSADVQDAWVGLMECDSSVAGYVVTALSGGRVNRNEIVAAAAQLDGRNEWLENWPERVGLLRRACSLLLQ